MNLKKILDSSSGKPQYIPASTKLSKSKVRELIASFLNIKPSQVKPDRYMFKDTFYYNVILPNGTKYKFTYYTDRDSILAYGPYYKVEYLRSTPFGYGGGWSSFEVRANSEAEAIENAKEQVFAEYNQKIMPCSGFKVVPIEE